MLDGLGQRGGSGQLGKAGLLSASEFNRRHYTPPLRHQIALPTVSAAPPSAAQAFSV